MKKLFITLSFLISLTMNAQTIQNYFSIDSVTFNQEDYFLAWSSFSDNVYYKHEYIRKTDSLKSFNKMILIEVLQTDLTPKDLASKKALEIDKRKKKDHVANYQIIDNPETGEYLIDFLISDGKGDLYEWNVYRYKLIDTPKGKAVMLFGFCLRSFDDGELILDDFFPYLKRNRMYFINQITDFKLPIKFIEQD